MGRPVQKFDKDGKPYTTWDSGPTQLDYELGQYFRNDIANELGRKAESDRAQTIRLQHQNPERFSALGMMEELHELGAKQVSHVQNTGVRSEYFDRQLEDLAARIKEEAGIEIPLTQVRYDHSPDVSRYTRGEIGKVNEAKSLQIYQVPSELPPLEDIRLMYDDPQALQDQYVRHAVHEEIQEDLQYSQDDEEYEYEDEYEYE